MIDRSELSCSFELKDEASDCATFVGVASTSSADLQNEIIEPGAFDPIDPRKVMMLRDHDRGTVIGGWTSFQQQGSKLVVEGELCLEVEKARETYALLRRGYLNGLSVGYKMRPDGSSLDRRTGTRTIKKGELKECSIVAFPANDEARIISVKSEGLITEWLTQRGFDVDDLEGLLRLYQEAKREDASQPWGDVEYADPGYRDHNGDDASKSGLTPVKRYPLDTVARIRNAWTRIHQHGDQYSANQLSLIKGRIVAAWKRRIDNAGPPAAQKDTWTPLKLTSIEDLGPVKQDAAKAALGSLLENLKGLHHAS